ncbi:MAG: hypothetical protein KKH28_02795 [Elusimicrobia bacterium]|nr:hypothetical protein [Elusimicrobiota bacterium]
MADKDPNDEKKMNLPPLPPGFARPGASQPPVPGSGKPVPPMPGQGKPVPPMPGGAPAFPFTQAPQGFVSPSLGGPRGAQAANAAAEEAARMKEEKDKLEKKINDMEHLLSREKEKALLATLKNQQDEALSSKVESSLKDIQDKLRRDRHETEVAEERLTLKAKIKELETKLVQERETWMQTLRGQMQERESASKDVEGHFIYRLQEMERRWLDEKAQWQKNLVRKEDEVRSLKHGAERLREVQDEFRLANLDKIMLNKEIDRFKDEMARVDRDKAAVDIYMRNLPEKERELATLRAEVSMAKMREERAHADFKTREEKLLSDFRTREEKLLSELGGLQKDIGSVSDRKNAEKEEELRKFQARYESMLQEKENAVATVSGEKIRAISELVKVKGFIARVQAVNAALDKERGNLRIEKMQMAQSMAANIEETKKIKQELEHFKATHQGEIDELMKKHQARLEQIKETCAGEVTREYNEKLIRTGKEHQEEKSGLIKKHQDELTALITAHQEELAKLARARQEESARAAQAHQQALSVRQEESARAAQAHQQALAAHQEESARAVQAHQEELAKSAQAHQQEFAARQEESARAERAHQEELTRVRMEAQAEKENKIIEMRNKYELAIDEITAGHKKRFEQEYTEEINKLKEAKTRSEEAAAKLEAETRRSSEEVKNIELHVSRKQKEFMAAAAEAAGTRKSLEARISSLGAEKADYEQRCCAMEAEAKRLAAGQAGLKARLEALAAEKTEKEAGLARMAQDLRLESDNRARFESELLFLKQKVQQMEYQGTDLADQLEAERQGLASAREAAALDAQTARTQIEELSAEIGKYKNIGKSFAERLKWALKGKKAE